MPDVDNQGVRIHYELAEQGRRLVLLHSATLDGSAWSRSAYGKVLERHRGLLILDWRDHGRRAEPHEPKTYRSSRRFHRVGWMT